VADSEAAAVKVRGMAFDVELVGTGCTPTYRGMVDGSYHQGESSASGGKGYGISMGSIIFNAQDPNNVDDWGDPQAPKDDPGAAGGYGDSSFTVELGSLYDPDNPGDAPDQSGELFAFYYDCNDCCGEVGNPGHFTVEITANAVRGGLVLEDGGSADLITAGCDVYCEEPNTCMADTNPDFDLWDSFGRPDCWCYAKQCRGDVDGKIEFGLYWIFQNDLAIFANAFAQNPVTGNQICADLDHQIEFGLYRVFQNDLAIFAANFAQSVTDCGSPPDSNFNFWIVP
jgi:hypothetical protein